MKTIHVFQQIPDSTANTRNGLHWAFYHCTFSKFYSKSPGFLSGVVLGSYQILMRMLQQIEHTGSILHLRKLTNQVPSYHPYGHRGPTQINIKGIGREITDNAIRTPDSLHRIRLTQQCSGNLI